MHLAGQRIKRAYIGRREREKRNGERGGERNRDRQTERQTDERTDTERKRSLSRRVRVGGGGRRLMNK